MGTKGSLAPSVGRGLPGIGGSERPDLDALAGDLSISRLASGTRDNLVGTLVDRTLGIGLFLALSFLLSPRELGIYYEIVALITILMIVGMMGIDVAIVRFTALASERRTLGEARSYFRAGVRITVATSLGLAAGLWVAAPALARVFGASSFVWPARLGALAIPFMVGTFVLVAPARGLKVMQPTVLAVQVCQPATALVVTLALVLSGLGLAGAVVGVTIAAAASWLLAGAMLVRLRLPRVAPPHPPVGRPLLGFALPVAGMTLTGTALLWVDTLLLGAFRPASEVATYGIIVRLLAIGSAVLLTVIQIFGPFVTQLVARGDMDRLREVLRTSSRWVILVAAPPLVLLAVSGDPVLRIFHQPPSRGRIALIILAAAFLVEGFAGPVGHVLTMSGRSWVNLANNAVSLVCNIGLNLLLIPRLGLIGAAISWAVVMLGLNVARILQVRSIFGITPFARSLARPVLALGVASGLAVTARHLLWGALAGRPLPELIVVGVVFLAAYGAALAMLRTEPDDRVLWKALVRPRRSRTTVEPT